MARRVIVAPTTEEWRARCPLRRWLARRGRGSVVEVLEATGTRSRQAVYSWMDGRAYPPIRKMLKMQKLTGITPQQWAWWFSRQPKAKRGDATWPRASGSRSTP